MEVPPTTGPAAAEIRWERVVVVAVALAVAGLACLPLLDILLRVDGPGRVFVGSDGPFAADQLQYMAWIRDMGDHGLAGDNFTLPPGARVFLVPNYAISALLWKAGLDIRLALLIWKPIAFVVLLAGFWLYVRRHLPWGPSRPMAFAVALFFAPPVAALVDWTGISPDLDSTLRVFAGESSAVAHLWGYTPTVLATGLMPLSLLAAGRALRATARREAVGYAALGGLLALLVAWLHPWQGATLVVLITLAAAAVRVDLRAAARLLPVAVGAGAALVYYAALARTQADFALGQRQNELTSPHVTAVFLAFGPLVLVALFGLPNLRGADFDELILVAWPVAVFGLYLVMPAPHLFESLSLPLTILGARAWQRASRRLRRRDSLSLLTAAALALAVPGTILTARLTLDSIDAGSRPDGVQAFVITTDERTLLRTLEADSTGGGVYASAYLAPVVPAYTGRPTWLGTPFWTPDFNARAQTAEDLFDGRLALDAARNVVASTGARFVIADCRHSADLSAPLAPVIATTLHFGCATLYVLRAVAS